MSTAAPRKVVVLVLALVQPFATFFTNVTGQGQSVAAFASEGNTVLKAAGYAFSIWGLLYAGCIAYGIYQALPRKGVETPLTARLGWPSALAFASCIAWVIAAQLDMQWPTVAIIFIGAAALILPLVSLGRAAHTASGRERWLVLWPLGGLAGWLTIAGAVNLVTVLTATDSFPAFLVREQWALAILAVAGVIALSVVSRTRLLPYALTFAWGLVAVAVAEWQRHPVLAYAAVGVAILLGLTLWSTQRRARILT